MELLSVVVPAHNEERELPRTLRALRAGLASLPVESELIVVDDASTDRTAAIAAAEGASVVRVEVRHIAAARNAGAAVARGGWLLFVDADTRVPESTLEAAVAALSGGAVGGGSRVAFEPPAPLWARVYLQVFLVFWRPLRLAAGSFLFANRADFEAVGGFDEDYFVGEEIVLSRALKRRGHFAVLRERVWTSARKARMCSPLAMLGLAGRLVLGGRRSWRRRRGLELWYDGRREDAPAD